MFGDDSSYLKAIEVLLIYLCQDLLQSVLNFFGSESAEEHHFDLSCHEKEVPSCAMDPAIKGKAIQHLDEAPVPRTRRSLQPKGLHHQGRLIGQNCAYLNS